MKPKNNDYREKEMIAALISLASDSIKRLHLSADEQRVIAALLFLWSDRLAPVTSEIARRLTESHGGIWMHRDVEMVLVELERRGLVKHVPFDNRDFLLAMCGPDRQRWILAFQ